MLKTIATWYNQTAMLVGYPVLLIVLLMAIEKTFFTLTCQTSGYRCEYSLTNTQSAVEFVGDLLSSNPEMDIVAKPRKR